jgi:ribosomal protein L11 methyltransferase
MFDLVMANILADPLCAMARDVSRVLAPGGAAILSGLIGSQAGRVAATFHAAGLPLRRRLDLGPWTTLLVAR